MVGAREESTAASETLSMKNNDASFPKVPNGELKLSSVFAEVPIGAVLVEDQVRAGGGPDLQREHLRPQPSIRIDRDRALHAAGPHTVALRKRPAQPVVRVQP